MSVIAEAALTAVEARRLDELETMIARGVRSFVEVGDALAEIRDSRLYRERYATFEDYCVEEWKISRPRAYELMNAAVVVSALADHPPANERVARELAPLRAEPDEMREAWQEALDEHGPEPTAAEVREHVQPRRQQPPPQLSVPVAPKGSPERDTRFEIVEDAVDLLKLMPAPEQIVFPDTRGDIAAVDEAIAWLTDWTPRIARAWRAHKRAVRRTRA